MNLLGHPSPGHSPYLHWARSKICKQLLEYLDFLHSGTKGALDNNGVAPFRSRIGINCKFLLLVNFIISLMLPNVGSGIASNPLASFIF